MLMHDELRCPKDAFSTVIFPMEIDYDVWIYKKVPDMQYGLYAIDIWSRPMFE